MPPTPRRTSIAAETAAAIDATVTSPVLVVGSPPPGGRDLDLLAADNEYDAIAAWLGDTGFLRWRKSWARFDGGGSVYGVDLSSTERWRSGGHDSSVLFEDAETISGFSNLVCPCPATVLLLAARGIVSRRGRVTEKVRGRVATALERDPEAWIVAEQRAYALGMLGALHLLRRACEARQPLPPSARAAGLAGVWHSGGPVRARARLSAELLPQHWRPTIVSFSGLDGSGKSTQGAELRDTLARLGVSAELQWAGFKTGSSLRAALPFLDRPLKTRGRGAQPATPPQPRDPLVPAACLAHPVSQHLWMVSVVALNAISLWRYVLKPGRGTKVLIFDRFSPDSAVKLDFHYGCNRHFDIRWQRAVFLALSPKPDVGFLVAVSGDVAYGRRQEQTLDELTVMARLYEEQVPRFGLVRLDGNEPADELSHRVIKETWPGLR